MQKNLKKNLKNLISRTPYHFGNIDSESTVSIAKERMKYLLPVKDLIISEKAKIKEQFFDGDSGIENTRKNTSLVDKIIITLYQKAEENFKKYYGNFYPSCSIIAVGGYGRGELNPYSDIDILFLYKNNIDRFIEFIAKNVISFLWDLGFEVGHSVRSIDNCIEIGNADISPKTAMLESRFVVGNQEIYKQFTNSFQQSVVKKGKGHFIQRKNMERIERIERYKTIYLSEPDVKEGIGGLRDFHVAIWTASVKFGLNNLKSLLHRGIIDQLELKTLSASFDYLLKVRSGLHYLSERKNDLLTHDYQASLTKALNYKKNSQFSGVERFMYDYFLHITYLSRFSSVFIKRCETYGRKGNIFKPFISREIGEGLSFFKNEMYLKKFNPSLFENNPVLLLKIFMYCQKYDLVLSERIKNLIKVSLKYLDNSFICSKEMAKIFLTMLKADNISRIFRMMHETGFLGAYIKEFEDITYRIHTDCYHKYPIDEHTLKAIEILENITLTNKKGENRFSEIYEEFSKPEIIKLSLLLHDIGKGKGKGEEHNEESSKLAKSILTRLNLGKEMSEEVGLMVRNHLLMSHTAQRRDISDNKTIVEFTKKIGNTENLKMLYLMTFADINAVGPNAWSAWKGELIKNLYQKSYDFLTRDETEKILTKDSLISILKADIIEALENIVDEEVINKYFYNMPDKYILSISPKKIIKHITLTEKIKDKKLAVECTYNKDLDSLEIMVCTTEKFGVFSKIAGTLTSKNLNILGAKVYTRRDGIAIDTIKVKGIDGMSISDKEIWKRIEKGLFDVFEGGEDVDHLLNSNYKYGSTNKNDLPKIKPYIIVDNTISDTHTIIETILKDRVGLLYRITNLFFKIGLNIYIAKISTEANKCINVFYVTDLKGKKILDEKLISDIKEKITTINEED